MLIICGEIVRCHCTCHSSKIGLKILILPHFIDQDNYSLKHEFSMCLRTTSATIYPIKQVSCFVAPFKIIIP